MQSPSVNNRGNRRASSKANPGNNDQTPLLNTHPKTEAAPVPQHEPKPALGSSNHPATTDAKPDDKMREPHKAPQPPLVTIVEFYYSIITDKCIANWSSASRALKASAIESVKKDDYEDFSPLFQEVIRSVLCDRLDPVLAGKFIKEILHHDADKLDDLSPTRHFVDCFSTFAEGGVPNVAKAKSFLISADASPDMMREQFEEKLLLELGLVKPSFGKTAVRHLTTVLYKQTTYNLLREDTEGYAKLTSEYYLAAERGPATAELVSEAFEKVKSLVGSFNIDSGRTLDVLLDVFGDLLVKRNRFFIRFLRASSFWPQPLVIDGAEHEHSGFSSLPWWASPTYSGIALSDEDKARLDQLKEARDVEFWKRVREVGLRAFFELNNRRIIQLPEDMEKLGSNEENRTWIAANKTFPPQGNSVAAQLLGFKMQFYTSDLREDAPLPENLIWLAALLIHIGFISLRDLYPHLYPSDDAMAEVRKKLQKEKETREHAKRPGGGMNALMMAGALSDDTLPTLPKSREPEKSKAEAKELDKPKNDEVPERLEPENQKIKLLQALLLIGDIPDALFMLGKFPWLIDLCPELLPYVFRILHHSLSKIVSNLRPLADRDGLKQGKATAVELSSLPKGVLGVQAMLPRKVLKWGKLDSSEVEADYKFYWDEWNDNVPVCQTVDDVFSLCSSLLNIAGVRIGEDSELITQLARIGSHSIGNDTTEVNMKRWIDFCKRLLVPALSFTDRNPGPINAVWDLIQKFPIATRYNIYSEWYKGQTSRTPEMREAFDLARAETKDVMKRISKQNTREMAKALAKITYGSPGVVFSVALSQIESYDNLIGVVVECARYFSPLAFDVLTFSILSSLGGGDRNRVQADGMLTSPWLRSLSQFAGTCFRRYGNMSPAPVLQYVAHGLRAGQSEDLEILEQMISSMAGIRSDTNFGDEQLRNMAGGPLLRQVTLKQVLDKRHESRTQSQRLIQALLDTKLAGQLLVLIAQEHQNYIYREGSQNAPLKVVANNTDKIFHAFVQYLDMLKTNLPDAQFQEAMPSIERLIQEFQLLPSLAFMIHRDELRRQIELEETTRSTKRPSTTPTDADVAMEDAAAVTGELADNGSTVSNANIDAASTNASHSVLEKLADSLRGVLPSGFEDRMSLIFYTRFWELSLYDMSIPKYEPEIKTLNTRIATPNSDRKDGSILGQQKREAERKILTSMRDGISEEMKAHITHYQVIRRKLGKEKDEWFPISIHSNPRTVADSIIQDCVFPRTVLSQADAIYSYKILFLMHNLGTVGFSLMHLFDRLFRNNLLFRVFFQCTPLEAENFGRFLVEVLKEFSIWHSSKDTFEKSAWGSKNDLPGFCRKVTADFKPEVRLAYEEFRILLLKWHDKLFLALEACLENKEYMHVKNAIIILKAVHSEFPKASSHGSKILEAVTNISTNDSRQDLKLSALSLLGDLRKKKARWVTIYEFKGVPTPAPLPKPKETPKEDKQASTLQPSKLALDPKATEYLPNTVNGTAKAPSSTGEVEDGEIDDSKRTIPSQRNEPVKVSGPVTAQPDNQNRENKTPAATQPSTNGGQKASETVQLGAIKPDRAISRPPVSNLAPPPTQHALPSRPEGEIPHSITHTHAAGDRNRVRTGPGTSSRGIDRGVESLRDNYRGREQDRHRPVQEPSVNRQRESREPREPGEPPRELFGPTNRPRDVPRDARREQPENVRDRLHPRNEWLEPVRDRDRGYESAPNDGRDRITDPLPHMRDAGRNRALPGPPPRDLPRRQEDDRLPRRDVGSSQHAPRRDESLPGGGNPDSRPRQDHESRYPAPEIGTAAESLRRDKHDEPQRPNGSRANDGSNRTRELFTQPAQRANMEPSLGRLGKTDGYEPIRQQDPNYGRLNPPTVEPPSGPRLPRQPARQNAGRNVSASQIPSGPRGIEAPTHVPTSPSAERPANGDRRRPPDQPSQRASQSQSTPVAELGTGGIHPSRLAQVQQIDAPSQPASTLPPAGPKNASRGNGNTPPVGPAPRAPRNLPLGPAAGGDQRHVANINSHLQQAHVSGSQGERQDRPVPQVSRSTRNNRNVSAPLPQQVTSQPSTVSSQPPRDGRQSRQDMPPPSSMMPPERRPLADAQEESVGRTEGRSRGSHHGQREADPAEAHIRGGRRREQGSSDRARSRSPRRDRDDHRQRDESRRQPLPPQEAQAPGRRNTRGSGQPHRDEGNVDAGTGGGGRRRVVQGTTDSWVSGSQGSQRGASANDARGDQGNQIRGIRAGGGREERREASGQSHQGGGGRDVREPRKRGRGLGGHDDGTEQKRPRRSE
jgi:THO complex subunit 2